MLINLLATRLSLNPFRNLEPLLQVVRIHVQLQLLSYLKNSYPWNTDSSWRLPRQPGGGSLHSFLNQANPNSGNRQRLLTADHTLWATSPGVHHIGRLSSRAYYEEGVQQKSFRLDRKHRREFHQVELCPLCRLWFPKSLRHHGLQGYRVHFTCRHQSFLLGQRARRCTPTRQCHPLRYP
jgi:hypothetical protein